MSLVTLQQIDIGDFEGEVLTKKWNAINYRH